MAKDKVEGGGGGHTLKLAGGITPKKVGGGAAPHTDGGGSTTIKVKQDVVTGGGGGTTIKVNGSQKVAKIHLGSDGAGNIVMNLFEQA